MALKRDGTVVAWGYNVSGTSEVPSGLTSAVGIGGGYSHSLAMVYPGPLAPVIRVQPVTQTVEEGSAVNFYPRVEGFPPLVYHWLFNNALLAVSTNGTFRLANVQSSDGGAYSVPGRRTSPARR